MIQKPKDFIKYTDYALDISSIICMTRRISPKTLQFSLDKEKKLPIRFMI